MKKLFEKYHEQISYLFWGGMTTLVSYATYFVFSRLLGLDPLISNVLSWICAVAFAYVTNKIFVFRSKSWDLKLVVNEVWKFVSARIFSFFLEMAIMFVFVKIFRFNDLVVKVCANIVVIIVNYFLSKFLIFAKKKGSAEDPHDPAEQDADTEKTDVG